MALESWGNETTMNMNEIVYRNVVNSSYYQKTLTLLDNFDDVLDEIKKTVTHLEPFIANSPTPYSTVSSAFCNLYKLWELELTVKQVELMIQSYGSPFVRCLGFLYLRYTYPPAKLMEWFADFLDDDEKVQVKAGKNPSITIGKYVRDLLLQKKYYNSMLPSIPIPAMKEIERIIKENDGAATEPVATALSAPKSSKDVSSSSSSGRRSRSRSRSPARRRSRSRSPSRSHRERSRDRSRDRHRRSDSRDRHHHHKRSRSRDRDRHRRSRSRSRSRSRDRSRR